MDEKYDIEKLEKPNVFKVPKNYFEGLPLAIQEKIAVNKKNIFNFSLNFVLARKKYLIPTFGIFLAVVLGIFVLLNQEKTISVSEYISENIEEFEEDLFYEILTENTNTSYSDEDIIEYLLEEDEFDLELIF